MKKKNKIVIFLVIGIIAILGIIFGIIMSNRDNTFTLDEKQWIEENKNKVIGFKIS